MINGKEGKVVPYPINMTKMLLLMEWLLDSIRKSLKTLKKVKPKEIVPKSLKKVQNNNQVPRPLMKKIKLNKSKKANKTTKKATKA